MSRASAGCIKIIGQHEIDLAQFIEAGAGCRQLIGKIKDRVSVFFRCVSACFFPTTKAATSPAQTTTRMIIPQPVFHHASKNGLTRLIWPARFNAALLLGRLGGRAGGCCGCRRLQIGVQDFNARFLLQFVQISWGEFFNFLLCQKILDFGDDGYIAHFFSRSFVDQFDDMVAVSVVTTALT